MANNVLANRVERQIKRDQWSPTPMWKQDGHNSTASPFPQRFLSRSRTTPPMFSPFSLLQPLEPGGGGSRERFQTSLPHRCPHLLPFCQPRWAASPSPTIPPTPVRQPCLPMMRGMGKNGPVLGMGLLQSGFSISIIKLFLCFNCALVYLYYIIFFKYFLN